MKILLGSTKPSQAMSWAERNRSFRPQSKLVRAFLFSALTLAVLAWSGKGAQAQGTVEAYRGAITSYVKVSGGPANATGQIWMSTTPGGNTYVQVPQDVTTDGAGNGKERFANTTTHPLTGYKIKVIFPGRVVGPVVVEGVPIAMLQPLNPGVQTVTVVLNPSAAGGSLLETWEPGSLWTVHLDPAEASFIPTGAETVSSTEGDLDAQIVSVTSSDVTVLINNNPSPFTPNSIILDGLTMSVYPIGALHPQIGLQGNVQSFFEDEPWFLTFSSPVLVDGGEIPVLGIVETGDDLIDSPALGV